MLRDRALESPFLAQPDFHPLGILLSFACLTAQAVQNTAADRLLRDHGAPIHEVNGLLTSPAPLLSHLLPSSLR